MYKGSSLVAIALGTIPHYHLSAVAAMLLPTDLPSQRTPMGNGRLLSLQWGPP
ncbi:hypothetical protein K458DRAFT_421104 [Lentithecium fluviatile CBS 122367]|uniref:Uncharacterized protein n=1 Tax=Lentithecium fluviatile CBS 122367 TaxID=1168545 RepID=A0A6G1IRN8_9PLEO|nr:hypothetical protein K458DRAFT_421104 [Lentithecium fluviatile CBS 122367]